MEGQYGEPFYPSAPAGSMLTRLLNRNHWTREQYRIDNLCRCNPPNDWFDERAPWYWDAATHCKAAHLDQTLAEPHKVVVTLGATALKHVVGIHKKMRVQDWHGTVTRLPSGQLLVPTFHPSHLQRGAHNLFGVVSFDLQMAHRVAAEGWDRGDVSVVVDPPLDWFTFWAEQVGHAVFHDPHAVWLAVDIETPDKAGGRDEGELGGDDQSYQITRVNFSVHPDEGISVPYEGPYIPLIERLLALPCPKALWNKEYDEPRLVKAGHTTGGDWYDFMWAWHHLQSDLPRGLGFAAPFYCSWGPWKHLSESNPGYYAGCDGFKTWRTATGIAMDLIELGMWEVFARHTHALHRLALQPAQRIGVKIDRERLVIFIHDLEVKQRRLLHEMQGLVPEEVRPLTPRGGYKKQPPEGKQHAKATSLKADGTAKKDDPDPIKQELYAQTARLIHRRVVAAVLSCGGCGAKEVARTHRCADKSLSPALALGESEVDRWYWQEPFNPDSPDQILAYLAYRKHTPGRAKKTGNDSTDRETLARLAKETGDPLYPVILKSRAVIKVKGTYGVGTLKRMDSDDRIHPTPTFKPSTHRLSYVNPNITNVITSRAERLGDNLASGFRRCVVADSAAVHGGTRLLEVDYSGIEAVLTGWYSGDPRYMWLARLGVHAGLTSYVLGRPFDETWPEARIAAYFKEIKKTEEVQYDRCKHTVHGDNYGLTEFGMVKNFPEIFPTLAIAKKFKAAYRAMAPAVPQFQTDVREIAYDLNYLGGFEPPVAYSNRLGQIYARNPRLKTHPFGYKHWFWAVLGFRPIPFTVYQKRVRAKEPVTTIGDRYFAVTLGDDAKRCVAFFPQSTAAGVLKEVMLRLFDPEHPSYVGDAYYGKTPFRAPIHDSLLFEVPVRAWDRVLERVYREMLRPVPQLPLDWVSAEQRAKYGFGSHLAIGVEGKAGMDWKEMETLPSPTLAELGVSQDGLYMPEEDYSGYGSDDLEEEASLGTVA